MSCLTDEQLFELVDPIGPRGEREALEAHATDCAACREALSDLRALTQALAIPIEGDEEAHVQRVMVRIRSAPARSAGPKKHLRLLVGGVASALALAAAVLLFVGLRGVERRSSSGFEARGTSSEAQEARLPREVGVRVLGGSTALVRLNAGATIDPTSPLTASYTNIGHQPAYLLLFAVDAAHEVHWLFPAYTNANEDPPSVLLAPTDREALLPTSVILDAPAAGPLRLVSVITEGPLHVSDIEHRSPADLSAVSLRSAFPAASITELPLTLGEAP